MGQIYQGGIPEDGVPLFPKSDSDMSISEPTNGPDNAKFNRVSLGSTDSNGDTGQDVNPPADGEVTIATRKVSSNQPS